MRIRKRFLSLSTAFTTPPSSDLLPGNHHHPPPPLPVQHQQLHPNGNHHRPPPPSSSDHTTQIGLPSGDCSHPNNTKIFKESESLRKKEFIKADDDTGCRKENILCAEANNHDLVLRGWLQGDRLVPMKKRRGSYGRRLNNDGLQDTMKPKAKMNDGGVVMSSKKSEKREGVIREGSRCSRVNGRGWRCGQQTLVGYSLCEHHLGKGRLRSMTSVRGRTQTVARKEQDSKDRKDQKAQSPLVDHDDDDGGDDDDDDDDGGDGEEFKDWDVESMSSMKGTKVFCKKRKLGAVKARSLSSLLSQIST